MKAAADSNAAPAASVGGAVPSEGEDFWPPPRARIDAYPTCERFGMIWVFLGDAPEEERFPLPEFPEGWQIDSAAVRQVDGDDVDDIVQCGTNLSTIDIFPTLELWLEKPLIPINVETIWHALRACGVTDRIAGKGRLLEEF